MRRSPSLKAHRAAIDAAYDRALVHVDREVPDGIARLRRALSQEGRRLMSRATAKAVILEHVRDGATGRASLRSLAAAPEPLIVAAAVGASLSGIPEAVDCLIVEAGNALRAVDPWISGNTSERA